MFTRQHFAQGKATTFAMIKPDVYTNTGKIIDSIYKSGYKIGKLKMSRFNQQTAAKMGCSGEDAAFMCSDVVTGMQLVKDNCIKDWNAMCEQIRGAYGTDAVRNAVHGSNSAQEQAAQNSCFFSANFQTSAMFSNCTCAVIKPHVVAAGLAGEIIDTILEEGFEISAM